VAALVYIFIILFGIAFSFGVYFALGFTVVEAMLGGAIAGILAVVVYERKLRHRAEGRLEKGIEELSSLLSTDAKAGQMLSKRMNKMADEKVAERLEVMEADFSVLGTVVRQVAEAVAQVEETQEKITQNTPIKKRNIVDENLKKLVSISDVKKALREKRVSFYAQPIVNLPQRNVVAYDLTCKMKKANEEIIDAKDFIPVSGNVAIVREIEQIGFKTAFEFNEKTKKPLLFYIPISKTSLSDNDMLNWIIAQLDKSREKAKNIIFNIDQEQWEAFNSIEKVKLASLVDKGANISISNVSSLRQNFAQLRDTGVTSILADAEVFIDSPQKYSDFEGGDVANYIHRYNIDLLVHNVKNEQQVLTLLEDGVKFIRGEHIAPPSLASEVIEF